MYRLFIFILILWIPTFAFGQLCQKYRQEGITAYNDCNYPLALKKFQGAAKVSDAGQCADLNTWIAKTQEALQAEAEKQEGITAYNDCNYPLALKKFQGAAKVPDAAQCADLNTWIAKTQKALQAEAEKQEGITAYTDGNYPLALKKFQDAAKVSDAAQCADLNTWIAKTQEALQQLCEKHRQEGITAYNDGNYPLALKKFQDAKKVSNADQCPDLDTWIAKTKEKLQPPPTLASGKVDFLAIRCKGCCGELSKKGTIAVRNFFVEADGSISISGSTAVSIQNATCQQGFLDEFRRKCKFSPPKNGSRYEFKSFSYPY